MAERKEYSELLASGSMLRFNSTEETALMTAKTVGVIEGINKVLEMEVEDDV